MAGQLAQGEFNISTGVNTSGSPMPFNQLGQIIYGNFFNTGAINAEPNRTYINSVECISSGDPNCPILEFVSDVGNTPNNPPIFAVRGYNEVILAGSKWGLPNETIQQSFGSSLTSSTGTEYVDSSYASANTGYPVLGSNIPPTNLCFNGTEFNHVGAERDVMTEAWWYDICQDTGQGSEVVGTLNNNYGTQSQTDEHNNQLLEVMIHVGPISMMQAGATDASMGQRNPAQFFCNGPITIGQFDYEIWYGVNGQQTIQLAQTLPNGQSTPSGALVVYNRIGPVGGPSGTDITNEGDINIDWSGVLTHSRNQLQQELINCGAWQNGQANSAWTNPNHPDNPFSRMQSSCGAISGIEFGNEPQLNNAADQPYRLRLDKLALTVNGENIGPCLTDVVEPEPEPEPVTCRIGQVVTFVTDTFGGCIDVPFELNCSNCDCEQPSVRLISGNPNCRKVGDVIVFELRGCSGDDCGDIGYRHVGGYKPDVDLVYNDPKHGGLTTFTIGPLKSAQKFKYEFGCLPAVTCVNDAVSEQEIEEKVNVQFAQSALALQAIKSGTAPQPSNAPVDPVDRLISEKISEYGDSLRGLKR